MQKSEEVLKGVKMEYDNILIKKYRNRIVEKAWNHFKAYPTFDINRFIDYVDEMLKNKSAKSWKWWSSQGISKINKKRKVFQNTSRFYGAD